MFGRLILGTVTAGAMVVPALAGMMTADEARRFVAGKVFAFTCFDGTRGAGRMLDDMGATGSIQFSGSGPMRHVRLPGNTLQIRGQSVCASLRGCRSSPASISTSRTSAAFRGSVSGMGFAFCDFRHQGASADVDGTLGVAAAFAAPAEATPFGRSSTRGSFGAGGDPGGREREAGAGQVRAQGRSEGRASEERQRACATFDRLIFAGSRGRSVHRRGLVLRLPSEWMRHRIKPDFILAACVVAPQPD